MVFTVTDALLVGRLCYSSGFDHALLLGGIRTSGGNGPARFVDDNRAKQVRHFQFRGDHVAERALAPPAAEAQSRSGLRFDLRPDCGGDRAFLGSSLQSRLSRRAEDTD
jgi:hypothetical protein